MGVKNFQIILQSGNADLVFFGGSPVTGTVRFTIDEKPKVAKGVRIKFVGEAKVRWTERQTRGSGDNRERKTIRYKNKERYVDVQQNLYGYTGDSTELQIGSYEFPFSFTLPQNIPSSFEGPHGSVRYYVEVVIDRPWKFNHASICFFTVATAVDLNMNSQAQLGIEAQNEKTLGILCCKSGQLSATVVLPRSGYVPGEMIPFSAKISNSSSTEIKNTTVRIVQAVGFYGHSINGRPRDKRKISKSRIFESVRDEVIAGGGVQEWSNYMIQIPPMPTSPLEFCSIIDISTHIELEVNPSGMHMDLEVMAPIVIGSIPLRNSFSNLGHSGSEYQQQESGNPFFQAYPDLPPPSYGMANFGYEVEADVVGGEHGGSTGIYSSNSSDDSDAEGKAPKPGQGYAPRYLTYANIDLKKFETKTV